MKGYVIRTTAIALAVSMGLMLLAGCHDQTQTPENQAATARRQQTIRQHKNDN